MQCTPTLLHICTTVKSPLTATQRNHPLPARPPARPQVQELLEVMGMKQYQEVFKIEQVNGEILTECDDELLASDLGVSSKLHRMRLMKVITGRHSARSILAVSVCVCVCVCVCACVCDHYKYYVCVCVPFAFVWSVA